MTLFLRLIFIIIITSALFSCDTRDQIQEPTIIYVPEELPPLSEIINDLGDDPIDPILAEGNGLEIRRSDLIRFLVHQYGKRSLDRLIKRELAINEIKRNKIKITASTIEKRAQQILEEQGRSVTEYLASRGFDRVTWVNELSILLGIEELCRHEMIRQGALRVRYAYYTSREQAMKDKVSQENPAEWLSPFMLDDPKIKSALFSASKQQVVYDGHFYWYFEILEKIEPIKTRGKAYQDNLKRFKKWSPSKERLDQYLDYLLLMHDIDLIEDRIYHELHIKKRRPS